MIRRIFIIGGHLTPALAVIEELKKSGQWEIFYLGRMHPLEGESSLSAEYQIVRNLENVQFLTLTSGRLQRKFTLHTIPSLVKIPIGFLQSFSYLIRFQPQVILSFGGYLAVPVAITASLLGIPVVTHEQTLVPGLATKIIAPFAKKVLVSWQSTLSTLPDGKTVLVGNPVRDAVFEVVKTDTYHRFARARRENPKLPTLYVTGGNQGSHAINAVLAKVLPKLLEKYLIIHQTGSSERFHDFEALQEIIFALSDKLAGRYLAQRYFEGREVGWIFKNSDLVISRSGINIISELAALGLPAILIPLPWSGGGEQEKNAQMLSHFGGAEIISQKDLTKRTLLDKINLITGNLSRYKKNAQKAADMIDRQAAKNIVSHLTALVSS